MVGLARISHHPDPAGEQEEKVEIQVFGSTMEVPGPHDLGPEHLLETFPGLVGKGGVRQDPHAVDDSGERRQLFVQTRQHRINRSGVGDVGQLHLHPDALPA